MLAFPLDYWAADDRVPQRKYPIELAPKASHQVIVCDIPTFRQTMQDCLLEQSKLGRFIFRFVRASVQTTDGSYFRAQISNEIRQELRELQKAVVRREKFAASLSPQPARPGQK
jgi:hypothetical protein